MAKDILIDISERDVLVGKTGAATRSFFDVVWGDILDGDDGSKLYANVVIPSNRINTLTPGSDGCYYMYIKVDYMPSNRYFYFRFVYGTDGYRPISDFDMNLPGEAPAYSYVFTDEYARKIMASQLMMVNLDGYLLIRFYKSGHDIFDRAYVYDGVESDFLTGFSDDQSAQTLAICDAGKYYRYPTTGIGITDYINSVVVNSGIANKILNQYEADGVSVSNATFASQTGRLQVELASNNVEDETEGLTPANKLDLSALSIMTDAYIRSLNYMDTSNKELFLSMMVEYDEYIGLVFLNDSTSTMHALSGTTANGEILNADGTTSPSQAYSTITVDMESGVFIVFDIPHYNADPEHPVMCLYDAYGTMVYADTVGADRSLGDEYMQCAYIAKPCTLKYSILTADIALGHGISQLEDTWDNYKNIAIIPVDSITGDVSGLIYIGSNITDIVENTQSGEIITNRT